MSPVASGRLTMSRGWVPIIAIALAAAVVRLAPLLRSNVNFSISPDDSYEYMQTAEGMRAGCGFARLIDSSCNPPEILRTPGYPLFLALIDGSDLRRALAVQAVFGGILCLLAAVWVRRVWGLQAAIVAILLIALDVPSIVSSNKIMSETLFSFMLLLAVVPPLLVLSRGRADARAFAIAVASGLALGFAILVRPIGVFMPILETIPFLMMRDIAHPRRLSLAATAFAVPALIVVGWCYRNYRVSGYFGLSTVGSINLYYYRAADVLSFETGEPVMRVQSEMYHDLGVPFTKIFEARVQSPELASRMNHLATRILVAHPKTTLVMTLQSFIYLCLSPVRTPLAMMIGTTGGSSELGLGSGPASLGRIQRIIASVTRSPALTILVVVQIVWVTMIWFGALRGLYRCRNSSREYRLWIGFPLVVALSLLALPAGAEADVRFRAVAIPLLAIAAALGYCARSAPAAG
jgi:hypothetical protein